MTVTGQVPRPPLGRSQWPLTDVHRVRERFLRLGRTGDADRGDEIGDLHARNGIIGFSDRMNAYHARMEEVLAAQPKLDAGAFTATALEGTFSLAAGIVRVRDAVAETAAGRVTGTATLDLNQWTLDAGLTLTGLTPTGLTPIGSTAGIATRLFAIMSRPYARQ